MKVLKIGKMGNLLGERENWRNGSHGYIEYYALITMHYYALNVMHRTLYIRRVGQKSGL